MTTFMKYLFQTNDNFSYWVPRVILGCVFLPHGAQKLFGWFGGFGFTNTMTYFTQTAGLPWIIAFLIVMGESLGALGLICIMVGAIITVHIPNGFFMNWFGKQAGEGFEYHLLVIGMSIPLLISGGGKYSVDLLINKNFGQN